MSYSFRFCFLYVCRGFFVYFVFLSSPILYFLCPFLSSLSTLNFLCLSLRLPLFFFLTSCPLFLPHQLSRLSLYVLYLPLVYYLNFLLPCFCLIYNLKLYICLVFFSRTLSYVRVDALSLCRILPLITSLPHPLLCMFLVLFLFLV